MATLFDLGNLFVLPFWLLMILFPRWRWTPRIMRQFWPILTLCLVYLVLLLTQLGGSDGAFPGFDLESIAALLGDPAGATLGWYHFLALDLFVGRWAYLDGRDNGLPAWLLSPILVLCMMSAPTGLLVYLAARWLWRARRPARPLTPV